MSRNSFAELLNDLLDQNQIEASYEAIRVRCSNDFQSFCEIFFPHYCKHPWNQFHLDCFEYYRTKADPARRVDCAPRGYAKSTVKTLFKPVHDICYQLQKYILFVAATKSQSGEKLKDIRAEIFDNALLVNVYGIGFQNKRVNAESFEVTTPEGPVFLRSVSAGTEVRGMRYREHRPTKIILDDAEDSEEVLSEDQREKTANWFFEVISKLGSEVTDIEIVGTVLHRDSLLMRLKRNPSYQTTVYKSVQSWSDRQDLWQKWKDIYLNLDDPDRLAKSEKFYMEHEKDMLQGTSVLWPEKESYLDLMKELEEIGKRAFWKEKQNTPMPSTEALFDNIWWYIEGTNDKGEEGFIIEKTGAFIRKSDTEAYGAMDPATGTSKISKKKLDFTCILGGYKDLKGRLFVDKDWTKREKPTKQIRQIFELNAMLDFTKFAIEENLFRGLLTENIVRERKRLENKRRKQGIKGWGIKVPFYEIQNREKKTERIFTLEPKVNNGWILFNKALSFEFMEQIQQFPSKEMHDDAPDTLEMLWGLINNRYKISPVEIHAIGSR